MSDDRRIPRVESFDGFYADGYRRAVALAYALVGNGAAAEDLAQEAFVAGLAHHRQGDALPGEGWLRTTARNFWLQHMRRRRRRPAELRLEAADEVWDRQAGSDGGDGYRAALRACMRKLSERDRLALSLRYGEGASREEMAERLDMQVEGVKSLLQRLRMALRACVERRRSGND